MINFTQTLKTPKYTKQEKENARRMHQYFRYDKLFQLGYWSMTTQKHINYVAEQLDLTLIK